MLFPKEEQLVANAAAKRRREFATVRACARTPLAAQGPRPILPRARGEPRWPVGIISMKRCRRLSGGVGGARHRRGDDRCGRRSGTNRYPTAARWIS
ncbi:hypothetical protein ACWCQK_37765 [Streptomyces sp. NPDC002306]